MSNCICQDGFIGATCSFEADKYPVGSEAPNVGENWRKARMDPSICLQYGCNMQICYVPHRDCRSYVVCQRTAQNGFVATKMRCAFGSFWNKESWTCERVEDLVQQKYTCTNDPCVNDKTIVTYADEDEENCRTFWKCDNGISKPMCCPPGQMFNRQTLLCVDDPSETCRSPCPLKIEGCSHANSKNVSFYDGNCRTFWDCATGHAHPVCCPARMSYNSARGYCVPDAGCTTACPPEYTEDICGKIINANEVQAYKLRDGHCRTYMKCMDGYDVPYCCSQEFYFDDRTGKCERVTNASDICNFEKCPATFKEECMLKAIKGKPKHYFDENGQIERECAPGTHFAAEICTCDGNDMINNFKECNPEVWAKFDTKNNWNVKNYGDGWLSPYGDLRKNKTTQGIHYGEYDGSSGVQVWRYDHTAFPQFNLEITFEPVTGKQGQQILASNCMSVDKGTPSLEVVLNPETSRITFAVASSNNKTALELPYEKNEWNTLRIMYDGKYVAGEITSRLGTGIQEMVIQDFRGDITAGVGSFKFGPCMNEISLPKNDGFTGLVSEIKFAKCVDMESQIFIRDNKDKANRGRTRF